ncbi:5-oxoprolinase subunit PxpB [Anaerobacillus sp. CMMVII]|uniref:5-oxoprolinase subunit PxpB n=1 Tax=Anaerobacillus sp. CMMVII TaxID=2755588 RepID=UPI0021B6FAB6|nr:5-oxoprolinase subunit PxpB [Anaerobacillus sp. CMMVII]MCT8138162.1 5-oxoprolinase subunit PxpB [Anaerobacillus sp. CMMVII]
MSISIEPLGDCGLVVVFGEAVSEEVQQRVTAFSKLLANTSIEGFIEYIPAYTTVAIIYNPLFYLKNKYQSPFESCKEKVEQLLQSCNLENREKTTQPTTIVPVCYGGKYGPDLETLARFHALTQEEVIELHLEADYTVAMIGFAPGFPYLSGLNERIATQRLATPRKKVPKGSVGIAGLQTGIYSIDSPGGWQIIGCTPIPLFDHKRLEPSLLKQGDRVRFERMSEVQFESWRGTKDEYLS